MSNPKELNKKKQEFLRLNGINVKVDGSWGPWQEEQYKKLTTKDKHYQTTPLGYLSYLYDKAFGETTYQEDPDYVKGYSGELTEDTRSDARRWVDHQMQDNKTPLSYVTQTVAPAAATAAALVYGTPVVVNGVTKGAPLLYNGVRTAVTNPATIKPALQTGIQTGLGYLGTLPGTVAGRFIGDAAGSMALGMGLEEGQRAAFGRSAGDIVYNQLKPYIGDFGANMARPEYIISPSMVLKNTYTQATNNLGRQFAISPQSQGVRKIRLKSMAERNPEIFEKEATSVPYQKPLNFIPMYEGNVGEFSKRFKQEILDRLSNLGVDIDKPVTVTPNKVTGEITITPRDFVNNSSDKVYYGIFGSRNDDLMSRQIGGVYAKDNGVVLADPTVEGTSAHHEVIGHRLFPIVRDLADKGTLEPYLNIYRSLKDSGNYVDITDIDELRATMLEVQYQIMKPIYEANPSSLSALRQNFQNYVDSLSDEELMDIVKNINGYGYDYAQRSKKETPHFIRQALKYAPIATGISIGLNNNNNNK